MQEISTVKLHAITRIILGRYRLWNVALALVARCPLLAQSGHAGRAPQCPLLGVKRTQSAVAEHTFKSSLRICEGVCPSARLQIRARPVRNGANEDALVLGDGNQKPRTHRRMERGFFDPAFGDAQSCRVLYLPGVGMDCRAHACSASVPSR